MKCCWFFILAMTCQVHSIPFSEALHLSRLIKNSGLSWLNKNVREIWLISGFSRRLHANGNPVNAAFCTVGAQLQQKDIVESDLANVVVVVVVLLLLFLRRDRFFCNEIRF